MAPRIPTMGWTEATIAGFLAPATQQPRRTREPVNSVAHFRKRCTVVP